MLDNIFSLHNYWILNAAIFFSYIICRAVLAIPFLNQGLVQEQRLQFARSMFVMTLIAFYMTPFFSDVFSPHINNSFQIQPLIKYASSEFIQTHQMIGVQLDSFNFRSLLPSFNMLFLYSIFVGMSIAFWQYLKSILVLRKIIKKSFSQHSINHINILFNDAISVPFCWSFFKENYIVIPSAYLEKSADLKLIIRHEMQHIRQRDTRWLHIIFFIKIVCFCNPFIYLWKRIFHDLQEYACDEALVLKQKTTATTYAKCLLDSATMALKTEEMPQGALAILGIYKRSYPSTLQRRITMLFHYKKIKNKILLIAFVYMLSFLSASSFAYALSDTTTAALTADRLNTIINESVRNNALQVQATPEVVAEINNIRSSEKANLFMKASLENMDKYKPLIQRELKNYRMPEDLLVIPLVESGYRPLEANENPMQAAGVWQIIPTTAQRFGLVINGKRDDRLDTQLSTKAALAYLNTLYSMFNNWKLAAIAYEYGEYETARLINNVGSRDPWVLARSPSAPKQLSNFLAMLDAGVIMMHNPTL